MIKDVPVVSGGKIANTIGYLTRGHLYIQECQHKYGDVFYINLPFGRQLMVFDPKAITQIFQTAGMSDKDFPMYWNLREKLGDGMVSIPTNPEHIERLRLMKPAYIPGGGKDAMQFYAAEIFDEISAMLADWESRGPFFILDTKKEFEQLAMKVIFRIMFGRETPEQIWNLPKHINNIVQGLMLEMVLGKGLTNLLWAPRIRATAAEAHAAIDEMIQISMSEKRNRRYMIDVLVDHLIEGKLTKKQLLDEFVTALGAGYETTARVLMWVFIQLAHNPSLQVQIANLTESANYLEEFLKVDLAKYTFLEGIRTAAPAPGIARHLLEDIQAGNFVIPAGTEVNTLTWLLNQDDRIYSSPKAFWPSRFAKGEPYSSAGNLGFGGFSRRCAGEAIATLEGALTVAMATKAFYFASINPMPGLKLGVVLSADTSKGGHLIRVGRR